MPCLDECFSCVMVTGSDKHCFSLQSCGVTLAAHNLYKISVIEGSLEVKLPTAWSDEKQRWEESEKRREKERRSKREEKRRRKKIKKEKVSEGRRSKCAKR